MFSPNMNSVPEEAALPGTVLIPMRFVWRHGGNSVFLCGSFTQWSQLVPMLPVENCDNVFQTVYGLLPGYHQYKFYVDGQWRYDESEHHVSGEYGIVNTLHLSTDDMDVDTETFRHGSSRSGRTADRSVAGQSHQTYTHAPHLTAEARAAHALQVFEAQLTLLEEETQSRMSSNLQEGAVGAGSSMTSAAGGHHIFSSFPPSTHTSSAYGTTVQFGDSSSSWPMTPAQGSSGSTSMTRDKKH